MAAIRYGWNCQDNTGNWVMCDSMGGEGMSGGGTVKECKRSACWYCAWNPMNTPKNTCGQTSQTVDSKMGCECSKDAIDFCVKNATMVVGKLCVEPEVQGSWKGGDATR